MTAGARAVLGAVARRRAVSALLGLWFVGLLAAVAEARPGGGHSYSGGGGGGGGGGSYRSSSSSSGGGSYRSSSSSGGSSSGGSALGVLLGVGIAGTIIVVAIASRRSQSYTTTPTIPVAPRQLELATVTERDPAFSRAVFEDFAYRLYAAAQRARHDAGELAKLTPYFSPAAADTLARRRGRVDHVVIGNLRIVDAGIEHETNGSRLVVAIEANVAGTGGTTNVTERWTFVRDADAKTRPPERTRTLACPSCNAPFTAGADPRTCAHCGTALGVGRFEWSVLHIQVDAETSVGYTLTGTVAEVGNDFPTLTEPVAHERMMALRADDPNVTWDAFSSRVAMIYARLNEAWNAQDLTPVRGLVTSSLRQYLQFWIDEYKRQGLANKLDDAAITVMMLAKVTRDPWFDAITVRVYAAGVDYTVNAGGTVVGGSKSARRAYTEYWTFLRSSARRGPITTTPACSNCGAPLAISDVGACTHCNAEVENASFDWTLSKIEQDDVYRG
jgi:predicted lipid-binding transport protein (Tim44 family)